MVSVEPFGKDIIVEHQTYYEKTSERSFSGKVLGYVTPWNNKGYDIAKLFTYKFNYISPVWLQLKRKAIYKYEILGKHDIDNKWLKKLRENNNNLKICPRVLFDGWTIDDFSSLFTNKKEQSSLANALAEICIHSKFDGVVLEVWSQIGGSIRSDILIDFIKLVSEILTKSFLEIILVVPPVRDDGGIFNAKQFNELVDNVAYFSLMTYDYSNPQRPGPNSPLIWVKQCVEALVPEYDLGKRSKILLGLNFYGNSYTPTGGGPIIGHEFVKLLANYKGKLKFDNTSQENFFEVR